PLALRAGTPKAERKPPVTALAAPAAAEPIVGDLLPVTPAISPAMPYKPSLRRLAIDLRRRIFARPVCERRSILRTATFWAPVRRTTPEMRLRIFFFLPSRITIFFL